MAHELAQTNGKTAMAFVGEKPWHGLGQELTPNASIATWKKEAGMDWEIKDSPIGFKGNEESRIYTGHRVLYRGDSAEQLSIVSDEYKTVQPGQVLDFFQDLVSLQGMKLNTAGCLFGGRKFWALADTGKDVDLLGNDKVKGMLLLVTSCDGTMATKAMFTSVRVVCNNTLSFALDSDSKMASRVTHSSIFDPTKVKAELGLLDQSWESFKNQITQFSTTKISDNDSRDFVRSLLINPNREADNQPYTVDKDVDSIINRIKNGMGADKAYGTLWGVLNGVTEFVDHEGRQRIKDSALWGSWFGKGANLKQAAFNKAVSLV
jgi:phage/plasmid-like protein (TIGR03299 family)